MMIGAGPNNVITKALERYELKNKSDTFLLLIQIVLVGCCVESSN